MSALITELTKREHFAGLAMQSLLADSEVDMGVIDIAKASVGLAAVLLKGLDK